MPGILVEIKSLFGDEKSFYDILNIKKEATKAEVKYNVVTAACKMREKCGGRCPLRSLVTSVPGHFGHKDQSDLATSVLSKPKLSQWGWLNLRGVADLRGGSIISK